MSFTAEREALAAGVASIPALAGRVHTTYPERLSTPCAVVLPAGPWMVTNAKGTIGQLVLRCKVVIVAGPASSPETLGKLEELTQSVLLAVYDMPWGLVASEIDEPAVEAVNTAANLQATLVFSRFTSFL